MIDAAMTAAIQAGLDPEILMACNKAQEELNQEARTAEDLQVLAKQLSVTDDVILADLHTYTKATI